MKRFDYNKMLSNCYQIVIIICSNTKHKSIDSVGTIRLALRAAVADCSQRILRAAYCLLAVTLAMQGMIDLSTNPIKRYAHLRVSNMIELGAMDELYQRESNWNPLARNGSHHGICQGKSDWLKGKDYRTQLDWCHRYIVSKYDGSYVKALAHWRAYGWH